MEPVFVLCQSEHTLRCELVTGSASYLKPCHDHRPAIHVSQTRPCSYKRLVSESQSDTTLTDKKRGRVWSKTTQPTPAALEAMGIDRETHRRQIQHNVGVRETMSTMACQALSAA